jgi:hypothetical protein
MVPLEHSDPVVRIQNITSACYLVPLGFCTDHAANQYRSDVVQTEHEMSS